MNFGQSYEIYMLGNYKTTEIMASWGFVYNSNGKTNVDVLGSGIGYNKIEDMEVYSIL